MEAKFQGLLHEQHRDIHLSLHKRELDDEAEPVVIGGMVLDIHASPSMAAHPGTTTPGKVLYVKGGVARNIAECMSKLGTKPFMISALGHDIAGNPNEKMAVECETPVWFEPVSVAKSKRIASVVQYISFASPNEDELVAMANAISCEDKYLPVKKDYGSTELSTEMLFQKLKPAIWFLLEKGIRVVIVTLGSHGAFVCCKAMHGFKRLDFKRNKPHSFSRRLYDAVNSSCPPGRFSSSLPSSGSSVLFAVHFPALSASVLRLTGAGDCLVGGTLSSFCAGLDIMQSVAVGVAAAKSAVETETNVPSEYVLAKIADDASSVYSHAKVVYCESKL